MKGTNVRWYWLFVLLGSSWVSVAQDALPPASQIGGDAVVYRVEVHVFRIPVSPTTDNSGNMIDREHVLQKIDDGTLVPVLEPDQNISGFGPTIELSVRGVPWTADKDGLHLPDTETLQDSLIEVVARPSILLPLGESAEVRIGGDQPVQYFEETEDDGVFALRTEQEFVGYVFGCTVTPSEEAKGAVSVKITSALEGVSDRRRSVPGLSLDVGRPMTTETRGSTTVTLRPKDWFALVHRTWDRTSILLTLVTIHESEN